MLHENKHVNFFLKLGYILLISLVILLTARYGVKFGWPFLAALLFSTLIGRPVRFINKKTHIPKGLIAAVFTIFILCIGALLLYFAASFVYTRSVDLIDVLPTLLDDLRNALVLFEASLTEFLHDYVPFTKDMDFLSFDTLLSGSLPSLDIMGIFSTATRAAGSIPSFIFTTVFIFMATYYFTVQRESITTFANGILSENVQNALRDLREFLYNSVFKWVKAQMILICITFVELLIAFLVLKQANPVLLAASIAVIDAMPILGVGTVLIPWALFCLLTGNFKKAVYMLLIYVICLSVRNMLEPKVVGEKIGLNPLVSLLSLFIGFRIGGFFGMVFVPIGVLSVIKLQELGYIKLWIKEGDS